MLLMMLPLLPDRLVCVVSQCEFVPSLPKVAIGGLAEMRERERVVDVEVECVG